MVLGTISDASAQQPQVVAGEYLVKFKNVMLDPSSVSQKIEGRASLKTAFKAMNIYHIALKPGVDEQRSLDALKQDPDVEFIEPNYILSKEQSESEAAPGQIVPGFSRQEVEEMAAQSQNNSAQSDYSAFAGGAYTQSGSSVQATQAWSAMTPYNGTNKVIVAIVDTGLDKTHKVFLPYTGTASGGTGSLWINTIEANGTTGVDDDGNGYVDDINGWNFISNNSNFYDDDGHGTHVAGIVVGAGTDILASPLSRSKIIVMPLKFLDASGSGSTANAIKAIYYAADNGAKVINNSWGGANYSRSLHEALTYAYNRQVTIVSAAGNYSKNNDTNSMYPSNYDVPSNIAVAATTDSDGLAYFSNYGKSLVSVASPGVNIYSTIPSNMYGYLSGTSMAAPFVAGIAALAKSESPSLSGYQIKNLIIAQANVVSGLSTKIKSSARVNALKTVQGAQGMVSVSAYNPSYSPDYGALEMASLAGSNSSSPKAGCGTVTTALAGSGGGAAPLGVLAGLMLLPLIVWSVLRAREESPKSRRKHERYKMNSEVRVKVGDRELVGAMNTISLGGISFNVDEALDKGGVVTMQISSPDGSEKIEVSGEIVWSEQNQAYGVQFSEAHNGAKAMIQHWTQKLVKSS